MSSSIADALFPLAEAVGFRKFDERLHPRDPKGRFTVIRRLGGTTGALLGQDELGRQFVQKGGASKEHAKAEAAANRLYGVLGVKVPRTTFKDGKLYAEYIPGKSLAETDRRERDGWRSRSMRRRIQQGFAADALLANWDVIGLEYDNIQVADPEDMREPYRIDNGGSLAFRAMGKPKGAAWGPEVGELGSLRNPSMNAQAARYFGDLTDAEVARQVRRLDLQAFRAEVGKLESEGLLSAEDARILGERTEYLTRWANATLEERAELPPLGLAPLEEAYRRQPSNRARPGDADYGIKAPKRPTDPDFEKKHPRGRGDKGGQFVRKGDTGEEVEAVQRAVGAPVTQSGGARSDKPGSFGYNTAASVRAFQRKHGLQVDGVVGRQTAAALLGSKGSKVAPGRITDDQRRGLKRLGQDRKRRQRGGVPARRGAGGYVIK